MDGYECAFSSADVVHLAPIFHAGRLRDDERLDTGELRARLERAGVRLELHPGVMAVLDAVLADSRPGDVVVTMSSGSFDGMPRKILAGLAASRRQQSA
jgi:UDP-N-acetylmuramate-alanine ligase